MPDTIITTATTRTTFPNMTQHEIPTLAKVGPVSWVRFKAECADLHDQLAVEIQADFPAYIVRDFPDLNPANTRYTILAARDEYVAHLQEMITSLHDLKGQPTFEQNFATSARNLEEEDDEAHNNDDNVGEDEVPDPPILQARAPAPPPNPQAPAQPLNPQVPAPPPNPQGHAPRVYAPPPYPPPQQNPVLPPQPIAQPQQVQLFQQFLQFMQTQQQPVAAAPVPVPAPVPAPPVVPPVNPPTRYKIALPNKYDGTPSRCLDFLTECENYFVMNPMTDEQQIRFTLQLLEKSADMWKCTSLIALNDQPAWANSWHNFRTFFEDRFRDKNERRKAVNDLMTGAVKQTHSTREFIDRVQDKCHRAGWNTPQQWMDVVRGGLKPELARVMTGRFPHRWNELVEALIEADEDLQQQKGREARSTSSKKPGQPNDPKEKRPAMSLEERERHYKEGLCFYCHKKGHSVNTCPKKKKKEDVTKVSEIAADEAEPTGRNKDGGTDEMKGDGKGFGDGK